MYLETERLYITPLEEKHLEPLRKMRLDPSTWHYLTDVTPINEVFQRNWYQSLCSDPKRFYFTILKKDTDEFVGVIRSDEYDKVNRSIRIGIDIEPNHRQQGYATEAFTAYIDHLFNNMNIHRIWFTVASKNEVAKKLYEKLGFKKEGLQREALFRDGWYMHYESMSLLDKEWKNRKTIKKEEIKEGKV